MFSSFFKKSEPTHQETPCGTSNESSQLLASSEYQHQDSSSPTAQALSFMQHLCHQSYNDLGARVANAENEISQLSSDILRLLAEHDVGEEDRNKFADRLSENITTYKRILRSDFFKMGDMMIAHGKKYPESNERIKAKTSGDAFIHQPPQETTILGKEELLEIPSLLIAIEARIQNAELCMKGISMLKPSVNRAKLLLSTISGVKIISGMLPDSDSVLSPGHVRGIFRLLLGDLDLVASTFQGKFREHLQKLHDEYVLL